MMQKKILIAAVCVGAGFLSVAEAESFHKNYISIVGSTNIEPYARAVNERFTKGKKYQAPLIQTAGTGGGLKLFCEGLGAESPDIAMAVRPMKQKERDACKKNGVNDIVEVELGYDAVVLAQSKDAQPLALTRKQAHAALGMWTVGKDGQLVQSPVRTWKDVNPAFPATKVEVHGPSNTSGVYEAFVDMISTQDCKSQPWAADAKAAPNPDLLRKCRQMREPGAYVADPIDSPAALAALTGDPNLVGIVDYGLLTGSNGKIRAIPIDGVEPTVETISSQTYPGTQRFFLYVKGENLGTIPGLKEYVAEFAGENALSEKGYLKPLGLVSLTPDQRAANRERLKAAGINPSATLTAGAAPAKGGKAPAKGKAKGKKK
jgi:phosphate transport system substrate-binding protein